MADDIYLSQEEQDERAKKWLKENGPALAIGIGLGLAAIFGFNQFKANKLAKAEQASALYVASLNEINNSDVSDISAQVAELKDNYGSSSYAAKAVLLRAKQLSLTDMPGAVKELQWVVDNASEIGLQHSARIRKAKIQAAMGDYEAAIKTATQFDNAGFESHYSEILADISAKQGDFDLARSHYQTAIEALSSSNAGYTQILTLKLDRLPGRVESPVESAAVKTDSAQTAETEQAPVREE